MVGVGWEWKAVKQTIGCGAPVVVLDVKMDMCHNVSAINVCAGVCVIEL